MRTYDHGGDVFAEEKRPMDFSVNINPLGMPKAAAEAAAAAVREELSYPDPFARRLTAALSKRYGVPEKRIVCGNGASDLMMRLCCWLEPARALVPAPGFSEYRRCCELLGAEVSEYPVLEGNVLDLIIDKALSCLPDVIFICRPNNPDGGLMSLADVEKLARFCERRGIVLVCDECFLEFVRGSGFSASGASLDSAAGLTERFTRLAVINAFTKTYAMAGLRLGFMFCSGEDLLEGTYSFGSPWSVSAPAQAAGEICCGETEFSEKSRAYIQEQRKSLVSGLETLGFDIFPSEANFLLVKAPQGLTEACAGEGADLENAERPPVRQELAKRGIKVRDCRNFSGLDDTYMRIGVRTEEENEALLSALKDILNRAKAPEETNG